MARFGTVEPLPRGWRSWLASWLGSPELATANPAAVAAFRSPEMDAFDSPHAASIWLVDPLHLTASLTSVHLSPRGLLRPDAPEQAALCRAFNDAFAGTGYLLTAARAGHFLASGPVLSGEIDTTDPARCLGSTLADALPRGSGAAALRRLGAEIEMWLHEHPINARRAASGRLPVSTLWLWGGGAPLTPQTVRAQIARSRADNGPPSTALFSDDAYVEGLSHLWGVNCQPAATHLADLGTPNAPRVVATLELFTASELASESGSGVAPLRSIQALDRDWLAPALDRLASGALARCALVANDRCVSLVARDLWRVWRRPRGALAALAQ
jgi:hypothetical protein